MVCPYSQVYAPAATSTRLVATTGSGLDTFAFNIPKLVVAEFDLTQDQIDSTNFFTVKGSFYDVDSFEQNDFSLRASINGNEYNLGNLNVSGDNCWRTSYFNLASSNFVAGIDAIEISVYNIYNGVQGRVLRVDWISLQWNELCAPDVENPTFSDVPAAVTLECGVDTYTELNATADDACDASPTVTIGGDVVNASVPADYVVAYTATDASMNEATANRTVTVEDNTDPTLTVPDDVTLECGVESYTEAGATAMDACDANPTAKVDEALSVTVNTTMVGVYTVSYMAADSSDNIVSATRAVAVVDTTAPTVVCSEVVPIKVGETFHAVSSSTDSCDPSLTINGAFTYDTAGVYTVTATVRDGAGNEALCEDIMLPVYDPSAGFVTGGGQINSPAGAFKSDPSLTGRAAFGFSSKYEGKGAKIPTGDTSFVFKAGGLSFASTEYDWLVVTGSNYAKFKGEGIIDGEEGAYKFQVWAGDGGKSGDDTFRIKIWEEADSIETVVVYDNDTGTGDDQIIARGQIKVHSPKEKVRALRGP